MSSAIEADWRGAGLDQRRAAILEYAEALTASPPRVHRAQVEALRAAGLSDRDILEVCEIVAYYAFVNRVADGLGVELEDHP